MESVFLLTEADSNHRQNNHIIALFCLRVAWPSVASAGFWQLSSMFLDHFCAFLFVW